CARGGDDYYFDVW
nr:immunoglobulin heavy chain junction region [Mus musculus]